MSNLLNTSYANYLTNFAFPVHSLYSEFIDQNIRVRDVLGGTDKVKSKTVKYLPKLSAQSADDYNAYLYRALFVNSSARIVNTNVGTIMRRTPTLTFDDEISIYFESDTQSFLSFREVFRFIIYELVAVGRAGVLIEIDDKNNRPIPVCFQTENIINWIEDDLGEVVSILLAKSESVTNSVTYETEDNIIYYNLYLDDGVYSIIKYDDKKQQIGEKVTPSLLGKTLDYIPFVCANPFGVSMSPVKSPIIDVVDVNLSHFRTSADLETGRHFVGLPQPIITGATSDADIVVGSSTAIVLPSEKAKAFYLEFLGQGLDGLSKALSEKESQMSMFSAQLMDTGSKGSEAEGTVRLRYSSDAANLSGIAIAAETQLNAIYRIIADWSESPSPSIELNKDFISDRITYNELRELTKSWMEGAITDEELRYSLKRGEVIPQNSTGKPVKVVKVNNGTNNSAN